MTPHLSRTQSRSCNEAMPPRVLVIDDDPLFRTLLVAMLKRAYGVAVASDGCDGFYKALETPPDVAVIDIQMPTWDGLRTIKAFREHATLNRVPLMILSSDATRETVLAAIAAGADDYLIKTNFTREELLEKLSRLRERRIAECSVGDDEIPFGIEDSAKISPRASQTEQMASVGANLSTTRLQETIDAWE